MANLKQCIKYFKYGYTGKMDNVIDFTLYKQLQVNKKFGNNPIINVVAVIITIVVCVYIWFQ